MHIRHHSTSFVILRCCIFLFLLGPFIGAGYSEKGQSRNGGEEALNIERKKRMLWSLVKNSPHKIVINMKGGFEIGIGKHMDDGTFEPKIFQLEELKPFYKRQKDKSIISVVINPGFKWSSDYLKSLSDQLLNLGYKRVVVVQNTGNGYLLLYDKINATK